MGNVVTSVLLPVDVYIKLVKKEIRPSDLKMVLQPVDSLKGVKPIKDREGVYKDISMPDWWKAWYKTLDRSNRLKFASIIQNRLEQMPKSA
ncbi:MAG: hypothetical protein RXO36_04210 [Candidatus Nanopusillus acidilobi]